MPEKKRNIKTKVSSVTTTIDASAGTQSTSTTPFKLKNMTAENIDESVHKAGGIFVVPQQLFRKPLLAVDVSRTEAKQNDIFTEGRRLIRVTGAESDSTSTSHCCLRLRQLHARLNALINTDPSLHNKCIHMHTSANTHNKQVHQPTQTK